MRPAGPGTKSDCAGDVQQKITRPSDPLPTENRSRKLYLQFTEPERKFVSESQGAFW
jgi:hypothetical protein